MPVKINYTQTEDCYFGKNVKSFRILGPDCNECTFTDDTIKAGSSCCQMCELHISQDEIKQIVECKKEQL